MPNSNKKPCVVFEKTPDRSIGRWLKILACMLLITAATDMHALRIIPHVTEGPADFAGLSAPLNGPRPPLNGSPTAIDCQEVGNILGSAIATTETGALCLSIAEWERHVRDNVTVELEFYKLDLLTVVGRGGILGGAFVEQVRLIAPGKAHHRGQHGYNTVLKLIKTKGVNEVEPDALVDYLPSHGKLKMTLPDNSFYTDNADYPKGEWKPVSISLSRAQTKALGLDPNRSRELSDLGPSSFRSVPNIDGAFVLNNDLLDPGITWDLDPTDEGPLLSGFTSEEYSSFDFTDPSTLPPNFILDPFIGNFQGVVWHEIGHMMGSLSSVDRYIVPVEPEAIPREEQAITVMDLFRVAEDRLSEIERPADFRNIERNLVSAGVNGRCRVDTGNAVMVTDLDEGGPTVIPLSSGVNGDQRQASHLRSPYNAKTVNQEDCTGEFIGYDFLVDGPYDAMRPAQGQHVPQDPTLADYTLFDLVGWDIDYSGQQSTSLEDGASLSGSGSSLQSLGSFAEQNRLKVHSSTHIILE